MDLVSSSREEVFNDFQYVADANTVSLFYRDVVSNLYELTYDVAGDFEKRWRDAVLIE